MFKVTVELSRVTSAIIGVLYLCLSVLGTNTVVSHFVVEAFANFYFKFVVI